jgi:hypothetical protein
MVYYWVIVKNEWEIKGRNKDGQGGRILGRPVGVKNPFLVVGRCRAIEVSSAFAYQATDKTESRPVRGGWRFFDFTFHRALSLTGPATNVPVKPSQNPVKPGHKPNQGQSSPIKANQ